MVIYGVLKELANLSGWSREVIKKSSWYWNSLFEAKLKEAMMPCREIWQIIVVLVLVCILLYDSLYFFGVVLPHSLGCHNPGEFVKMGSVTVPHPPKSWVVSKGLNIWWLVLFRDGHFIQSGALRIVTGFIYGHEKSKVPSALRLLSWEDVVGAVRSGTAHLIVRASVQNKACLRQAEWNAGGTDRSHHH